MGFLNSKPYKIVGLVLAILAIECGAIFSVPTTSAFHNPPNAGSCNNIIQVTTSENPSCDSSINSSMTSYSTTYHVQSLTSNPYTLQWNKESWYCTDPFPHDGTDKSRLACLKSPVTSAGSTSLPGNRSTDVVIPGHFDQAACGSLQTDLSFKVIDNNNNMVCTYGTPDFTFGFSFCSTGKTCGQPTPTQTTSKPTLTPTCTTTPRKKPTPTSTTSVTPTGSLTATATPTSGAPTPTPTSGPTSTPTPTGQPIPTQSGPTLTPQPTNENLIINVSQSQQQQQQLVLAATVAPAPQTTQLPSTGGGADVFFTLLSLIPIGIKLKKLG